MFRAVETYEVMELLQRLQSSQEAFSTKEIYVSSSDLSLLQLAMENHRLLFNGRLKYDTSEGDVGDLEDYLQLKALPYLQEVNAYKYNKR